MKKFLSIILAVCLLLSVVPTSVFVYAAEAAETTTTETTTEITESETSDKTEMVIDFWDGTYASGFASGDGTIDNPFIILTAEQMAYACLRQTPETSTGKYYRVDDSVDAFVMQPESVVDIDVLMSLEGYEAVKTYFESLMEDSKAINWISKHNYKSFNGNFDGNGITIYGLYADSVALSRDDCGLFPQYDGGYIDENGVLQGNTVKNIAVKNSYFKSRRRLGAIAAACYGTNYGACIDGKVTVDTCAVINCYMEGQTQSINYYKEQGVVIGGGSNDEVDLNSILVKGTYAFDTVQSKNIRLRGAATDVLYTDESGTSKYKNSVTNSVILDMAPYGKDYFTNQLDEPYLFTNVFTDQPSGNITLTHNSSTCTRTYKDSQIKQITDTGFAFQTQATILDWKKIWFSTNTYPELKVFHNLSLVMKEASGHQLICDNCNVQGAVEKHNFNYFTEYDRFVCTICEYQGDFEWEFILLEDGICLTKYKGNSVDIVVPSHLSVDGVVYPIIKLNDRIFENNDAINSVTLPETMLAIGDRAFYDCDQLVTVVANEQLTTIGAESFYGCDVFNSIIVYDAVIDIDENAFAECPSLVFWCEIDSEAFYYALENGLSYKTLDVETQEITSNGITYLIIGDYAIATGCTNTSIYSATIPETVNGYPVTKLIGTFKDCTKLTSVTLPDGLKEIGNSAFKDCSKLTSINIPDTVTRIGKETFYDCYVLESIEFSNSLKAIGNCAFDGCGMLTSIELPDSLISIGDYAFRNCHSLKNVKLSNNLETIGIFAFNIFTPSFIIKDGGLVLLDSFKIEKVIIPESVTQMDESSFTSNTILMVYENSYAHTFAIENNLLYFIYDGISEPETIVLDEITYYIMNDEAVAIDCRNTNSSITLPKTVEGYPLTTLKATFALCSWVEEITLPETITNIGSETFFFCWVEALEIPDSVTFIDDRAFWYCLNLTTIEFPDNLTALGDGVLGYCGLTEIILPDNLTSISAGAFFGDTELTAIQIPESVKNIGMLAFAGCASLSNVKLPDGLTTISEHAFYSVPLERVIIPESVTEMYVNSFESNTLLLVYEDSYAHQFAVDNDLFYFVYDGTNEPEIVTLDGITYAIINQEAIAIDCEDTLTEVIIPETVEDYPVTELRGTFSQCSNLTSVILPDTIIEIGDYTFQYCNFTSIKLPKYLTKIGNSAFYYCDQLTSIDFPEGLTYIGELAFCGCDKLVTLKFPDSLTTIDSCAFENCDSLDSVLLNNGLKKIGSLAFYNGSSYSWREGSTEYYVESIIIPSSVENIQINSFMPKSILMVYSGSYAHTFAVENNLLYSVLPTNNPEVAYGAKIGGTVTYTDGTIGTGATVDIIYNDGYVKESVIADENGAYEFTYAEVGRYTIRATDANGNTASTTVNVKRMNAFDVYVSGDTALTLKKGYSVSGTVNEPGANITLTDTQGNVIGEITADSDGNFTLDNIPNGEYIIKAESENGTAIQEATVFDGNVSDIVINIETETVEDTATIWGYVEVEDREYNHHRRNWVEVKLYDADGNVIATTRSDKDGKYSFGNLPLGEYVIVAETAEMREDKHHNFNRSHTLTGYAYVNVETAGDIQAETIVLYEENDHLATISGKVTAHGESQACEVTLTNVFHDEVATVTTKKNGKYSFSNVRDGMYFITAVTESDGMGYTVVVARRGKVFGNTNITVYKADKIKDREDKFKNEIPTCNSKDDAKNYRSRIAEEKRFYDGLSKKEKKQLSREYVDRLNKLCEWISDCEYTTNDGVTVEQGGLVMSGDELENSNNVSFNITVEKTDVWETNTDGVKDDRDFVYHNMKDKADDRVMTQYYEISMSKTVDGEEKQITSVYKDTDAMGKFRITMNIPEEYRGYKNYSVVHVHHGETVILTDLDDNPDTITFEVDKFSTFVLTATDETLGEAVPSDDALKFDGASLTLTDSIAVNYKVNKTVVTESGFSDLYVKFTFGGKEYIVSEYTEDDEYYVFTFDSIAPNRMNDIIYAILCGTKDGIVYESADTEYSIATYCYNMLAEYSADEYAELRTLLVDLLNYGAQSQIYTSYNIENPANANLTDAQKTWGTQDTRNLNSVQNLKYETVDNPTVSWKGGGLYLEDSITMRFTIEAESIENLKVVASCGDESWEITSDSFVSRGDNKYYVYFSGLNPTQMSEEVYLTVYNGDTAVSNTICYSIESYAAAKYNAEGNMLSDLVVAMMKYGDAAKAYSDSQQSVS